MNDKLTKSTYAIQVLEILQKHSDRDHPIKQSGKAGATIVNLLAAKVRDDFRLKEEPSINRKTVADAVNYLTTLGYEIRDAKGGEGIYLKDRLFSEHEALRLSAIVAESTCFTEREKRTILGKVWKDQSEATRKKYLEPILASLPKEGGNEVFVAISEAARNDYPLKITYIGSDGRTRRRLFHPMDYRFGDGPEAGGPLGDEDGADYAWLPLKNIVAAEAWTPKDPSKEKIDSARKEEIARRIEGARRGEETGLPLPRPCVGKEGTILLTYSGGPFSGEDAEQALSILRKKRLLPKDSLGIQEIADALPQIERTQEGLGALLVLLTGIVLGESSASEEVHDALLLARWSCPRFEPLAEWGYRFYYSLLRHLLFDRPRDIAWKAVQRRSLTEIPPLDPDFLCDYVGAKEEWDALYEKARARNNPWLQALLYAYLVNFSGTKEFSKGTIEGILRVATPREGYLSPALRVAIGRLDPKVCSDEKRREYIYQIANEKNLMMELFRLLDEKEILLRDT